MIKINDPKNSLECMKLIREFNNSQKKSKRNKNDFYPTPTSATYELLKHINPNYSDYILECCSGDNDITKVLVSEGYKAVITNDIDESKPSDYHLAAQDQIYHLLNAHTGVDWTITNPPFNQAIEIVKTAYEQSTKGIAMLLRISFLEPTKDRGSWLEKNPPNKLIYLPRISFTGDGKTDSVTCAWMIWEKHPEKETKIVVSNHKYRNE